MNSINKDNELLTVLNELNLLILKDSINNRISLSNVGLIELEPYTTIKNSLGASNGDIKSFLNGFVPSKEYCSHYVNTKFGLELTYELNVIYIYLLNQRNIFSSFDYDYDYLEDNHKCEKIANLIIDYIIVKNLSKSDKKIENVNIEIDNNAPFEMKNWGKFFNIKKIKIVKCKKIYTCNVTFIDNDSMGFSWEYQ